MHEPFFYGEASHCCCPIFQKNACRSRHVSFSGWVRSRPRRGPRVRCRNVEHVRTGTSCSFWPDIDRVGHLFVGRLFLSGPSDRNQTVAIGFSQLVSSSQSCYCIENVVIIIITQKCKEIYRDYKNYLIF